MTEWLIAALPYIGSGVVGSAATYGVTWVREKRRTLDAYRAPQRQAIADIIAAGHELQLGVLDWRFAVTNLIEAEQNNADDLPAYVTELRRSVSAYAVAVLNLRRAFDVGSLTVVDAQCWEAMVSAAAVFSRLDEEFDAGATLESNDEVAAFCGRLEQYAAQLRASMTGLVRAANERVAPAETRRNRRLRKQAQHRLGESIRADNEPEALDP